MWRIVVALGVTLIYGCTRKNDPGSRGDSTPPVAPTLPPPVTPRNTGPLIPPDWIDRYNRSAPPSVPVPNIPAPSVNPPALADQTCSRFTTYIQGPWIPNPKEELRLLQQEVMPRVNQHLQEMRSGDFRSVQRDTALSASLSQLQGLSMYCRNGIQNVLDTEADWGNLNAALSYLTFLSNIRPGPTPDDYSRAYHSWRQSKMLVQFRGFMFREDEAPHDLANQTSVNAPDPASLQFRIIHSNNKDSFPVLRTCNVPSTYFSSIDFNDGR